MFSTPGRTLTTTKPPQLDATRGHRRSKTTPQAPSEGQKTLFVTLRMPKSCFLMIFGHFRTFRKFSKFSIFFDPWPDSNPRPLAPEPACPGPGPLDYHGHRKKRRRKLLGQRNKFFSNFPEFSEHTSYPFRTCSFRCARSQIPIIFFFTWKSNRDKS